MWTFICKLFFGVYVNMWFYSFWYMVVELLNYVLNLCLNLWGTARLFSEVDALWSVSTSKFSAYWVILVLSVFFYCGHPSEYKVASLVYVLVFIYLISFIGNSQSRNICRQKINGGFLGLGKLERNVEWLLIWHFFWEWWKCSKIDYDICEYTKNHWLIHLKSINFMPYELYLNKRFKINWSYLRGSISRLYFVPLICVHILLPVHALLISVAYYLDYVKSSNK
jgi:hypothetical protein